jgi:hypothetical protein
MSTVQNAPITWVVEHLMCDCGGEFKHMHSVKYVEKPFIHACDKCSLMEDTVAVYPRTVWRET